MTSSSCSSDLGSPPNMLMLATGATGSNTTTTHHQAADHQKEKEKKKEKKNYVTPVRKAIGNQLENSLKELMSIPTFGQPTLIKWGNTDLSVAAMSGQTIFLMKLLALMPVEALLAQYDKKFTILHNVATNGNVNAAKILVAKNQNLTQILNKDEETPILRAAIFGHEDLLRYLLSETRDEVTSVTIEGVAHERPSPFMGEPGATLLVTVIDADLYDVAVKLVQDHPEIATMKDRKVCNPS